MSKKTFDVQIEITSSIQVEADSVKEAIAKAKELPHSELKCRFQYCRPLVCDHAEEVIAKARYKISYQFREKNNSYQNKWDSNYKFVTAQSKQEAVEQFKSEWTADSELVIKTVELSGVQPRTA